MTVDAVDSRVEKELECVQLSNALFEAKLELAKVENEKQHTELLLHEATLRIIGLTQETESLEKRLDDAEESQKEMQKTLDDFNRKAAGAVALKQESNRQQEKIAYLEKRNKFDKIRIEQLAKDLHEQMEQHAVAVLTERQQHRAISSQAKSENMRLAEELGKFKLNHAEHVAKLQGDLDNKQEELQAIRNEIQSKTDRVAELQSKLRDARDDVLERDADNAAKIQGLEGHLREAQQEIREKTSEAEKAEEKVRKADDDIRDLKQSVENLKDQLTTTNRHIQELDESASRQKDDLKSLKERSDDLNRQKDEAQTQLALDKEAISTLQNELDDQSKQSEDFKKKLEVAQESLNDKTNEVSLLTVRTEKLTKDVETSQNELEATNTLLRNLKHQYENNIRALEDQHNLDIDKLTELTEQIQTQNSLHAKELLKHSVAATEARTTNARLVVERQAAQDLLEQSGKDHREAQKELKRKSDELATKLEAIKEADARANQERKRATALKEKLDTEHEQIEQLKNKLHDSDKSVQHRDEIIGRLKQQLTETNNRAANLKEQLEKLEESNVEEIIKLQDGLVLAQSARIDLCNALRDARGKLYEKHMPSSTSNWMDFYDTIVVNDRTKTSEDLPEWDQLVEMDNCASPLEACIRALMLGVGLNTNHWEVVFRTRENE